MADSGPSRWWIGAAALAAACALVFLAAAVEVHLASTRPIGEGQLFAAETTEITAIVTSGEPLDVAVRRARATFDVEAVSLVGETGSIGASSSETLLDTTVEGTLAFGHGQQRMVAVAGPQEHPIEVDGVPLWAVGETLYSVVQPVDDGRSVLVHYDISGLLAKRIRPGGLSGPAIGLVVAAAIAAIGVGLFLIGRERAVRRYREASREAEIARAHSMELETQNAELDRARAAAERALALAEEKHRIRSEFVLMINHELRTPLTSVTTGARLLEDGHLTEDDRAMILEGIVSEADRLESIIDHVLAVARIENQGIESPLLPLSGGEVVDAVRAVLPRLVSVEVLGDLDGLVVHTDRQTLGQLLASLADNAHTHGASTVRLQVSQGLGDDPDFTLGTPTETALCLSIIDDGPGIDREFLPRAFEKFEKLGFASGTGLGLYLTRLMAEAIGASIAVTTGPGGTTMAVSVPVTTIPTSEVVPV